MYKLYTIILDGNYNLCDPTQTRTEKIFALKVRGCTILAIGSDTQSFSYRGGVQTHDHRSKNPRLYQLSYTIILNTTCQRTNYCATGWI